MGMGKKAFTEKIIEMLFEKGDELVANATLDVKVKVDQGSYKKTKEQINELTEPQVVNVDTSKAEKNLKNYLKPLRQARDEIKNLGKASANFKQINTALNNFQNWKGKIEDIVPNINVNNSDLKEALEIIREIDNISENIDFSRDQSKTKKTYGTKKLSNKDVDLIAGAFAKGQTLDPLEYLQINASDSTFKRLRPRVKEIMNNAVSQLGLDNMDEIIKHYFNNEVMANSESLLFTLFQDYFESAAAGESTQLKLDKLLDDMGLDARTWRNELVRRFNGLSINYSELFNFSDTHGLGSITLRIPELKVEEGAIGDSTEAVNENIEAKKKLAERNEETVKSAQKASEAQEKNNAKLAEAVNYFNAMMEDIVGKNVGRKATVKNSTMEELVAEAVDVKDAIYDSRHGGRLSDRDRGQIRTLNDFIDTYKKYTKEYLEMSSHVTYGAQIKGKGYTAIWYDTQEAVDKAAESMRALGYEIEVVESNLAELGKYERDMFKDLYYQDESYKNERQANLTNRLGELSYESSSDNEWLMSVLELRREILRVLEQEGLMTDKLFETHAAINMQFADRISLNKEYYKAVEDADNIRNITDNANHYNLDELVEVLAKRKEVMSSFSQEVLAEDMFNLDIGLDDLEEGNKRLERRIELLRQVEQGLISIDDVDDIITESGSLDDKLSHLQSFAELRNLTKKGKDDYDDDVEEDLEAFKNIYDRIILKFNDGKSKEILADETGLNGLRNFLESAEREGLGSYIVGKNIKQIEDIVFVRKQELATVEQTNDALQEKARLEAQAAQEARKAAEAKMTEAVTLLGRLQSDYADRFDSIFGSTMKEFGSGITADNAEAFYNALMAKEKEYQDMVAARIKAVSDFNTSSQELVGQYVGTDSYDDVYKTFSALCADIVEGKLSLEEANTQLNEFINGLKQADNIVQQSQSSYESIEDVILKSKKEALTGEYFHNELWKDTGSIEGVISTLDKVRNKIAEMSDEALAGKEKFETLYQSIHGYQGTGLKGKQDFQNAIKDAWREGSQAKAAKLFEQYKVRFSDGKFDPDKTFGSEWTNNYTKNLEEANRHIAEWRTQIQSAAKEYGKYQALLSLKRDETTLNGLYATLDKERKINEAANNLLNQTKDTFATNDATVAQTNLNKVTEEYNQKLKITEELLAEKNRIQNDENSDAKANMAAVTAYRNSVDELLKYKIALQEATKAAQGLGQNVDLPFDDNELFKALQKVLSFRKDLDEFSKPIEWSNSVTSETPAVGTKESIGKWNQFVQGLVEYVTTLPQPTDIEPLFERFKSVFGEKATDYQSFSTFMEEFWTHMSWLETDQRTEEQTAKDFIAQIDNKSKKALQKNLLGDIDLDGFLKEWKIDIQQRDDIIQEVYKLASMIEGMETDSDEEKVATQLEKTIGKLKNATKVTETSEPIYDKFYEYMRNTVIGYDPDDTGLASDFGDDWGKTKQKYQHWLASFKTARGGNKGSIDQVYMDLMDIFPEFFSEEIVNPSDQLRKIFEVLDRAIAEKKSPKKQTTGQVLDDIEGAFTDQIFNRIIAGPGVGESAKESEVGMQKETKGFAAVESSAKKAAKAKGEFTKANKGVAGSIPDSVDGLEKEEAELEAIAETAEKAAVQVEGAIEKIRGNKNLPAGAITISGTAYDDFQAFADQMAQNQNMQVGDVSVEVGKNGEAQYATIKLINEELAQSIIYRYEFVKAEDEVTEAFLTSYKASGNGLKAIKNQLAAQKKADAEAKKAAKERSRNNQWLIKQQNTLDSQETKYKHSRKSIDGATALMSTETSLAADTERTIDSLAQHIKANIKNALENGLTDGLKEQILNDLRILKNEITVAQNKEYSATKMKASTVETNRSAYQEYLRAFEANAKKSNVFEVMEQDIKSLNAAVDDIKDADGMDKFVDQLKIAEKKLQAEKAQQAQLAAEEKQRVEILKQQEKAYDDAIKKQDQLYKAKQKLAVEDDPVKAQILSREIDELQEKYDISLSLLRTEEDYYKLKEREIQQENELSSAKYQAAEAEISKQEKLNKDQQALAKSQADGYFKEQEAAYNKSIALQEQLYNLKKKMAKVDVGSADAQALSRQIEAKQAEYDASLKLIHATEDLVALEEQEIKLQGELTLVKQEKQNAKITKGQSFELDIDRQFSLLTKQQAQWEKNGQLTDELRQKIESMFNALAEVIDSPGLSVWKKQWMILKDEVMQTKYEIEAANKAQKKADAAVQAERNASSVYWDGRFKDSVNSLGHQKRPELEQLKAYMLQQAEATKQGVVDQYDAIMSIVTNKNKALNKLMSTKGTNEQQYWQDQYSAWFGAWKALDKDVLNSFFEDAGNQAILGADKIEAFNDAMRESARLAAKQKDQESDKQRKEQEKEQKKIDRANQSYGKTQYNREIKYLESLIAKINSLNLDDDISDLLSSKIKQYNKVIEVLKKLRENFEIDPSAADNVDLRGKFQSAALEAEKLRKEITEIYKESEKLSQIPVENIFGTYSFRDNKVDSSDIAKRKQAMIELAETTARGQFRLEGFNATYTEMYGTVEKGNGIIQEVTVSLNRSSDALIAYQSGVRRIENSWAKLGKTLKGTAMQFARMYLSFYDLIRIVRQGLTYVKEIDLALTELKKVTSETDLAYKQFLNDMASAAKVVGSTTTDLTNSAADWARVGYSMKEAGELAQSTAVLMNVSEFDNVENATEALTSVLQAFNYTVEDSIHIVDKLNVVGNNFAISSYGAAEGLKRSAATLVAAGNSLEESLAMLAAGNRVMQDPEGMGNALKVLSMRIRGVKTELEEAGEDTEGMITNTSKLQAKIKALTNVDGKGGVNILTDDGNFKSTYQILLAISEVWEKMDDISQAALLEVIAGKVRGSQVAAILQNPKDLKEAYEMAFNSAGSALEENEKYLDSIQGRINLFTTSLETFWQNLISSDAIKWIVDRGTDVINVLDTWYGKVMLIISAMAGFAKFKGFSLFGLGKSANNTIQNYMQALTKLNALKSMNVDIGMGDNMNTAAVAAYASAVDGLTVKKQAELLATANLNKAQIVEVLRRNGVEEAVARETAAKVASLNATKALKAATVEEVLVKTLGAEATQEKAVADFIAANGSKKLTARLLEQMVAQGLLTEEQKLAILTNYKLKVSWKSLLTPMNIAIAVVTAAAFAFDHFNTTAQEAADEAQEAFNELQNVIETTKSNIHELESEISTLQDKIDELSVKQLSFAEDQELDRLKQQREELEHALKVQEQILELQRDANNKQAIASMKAYTKVASAGAEETQKKWNTAGTIIGGIIAAAGVVASVLIPGDFGTIGAAAAAGGKALASTKGMIAMGAGAYAGSKVGEAAGSKASENDGTLEDWYKTYTDAINTAKEEKDKALEEYQKDSSNIDKLNEWQEAEKKLADVEKEMYGHLSQMQEYISTLEFGVSDENDKEINDWYTFLDKISIANEVSGARATAFDHIFGEYSSADARAFKQKIEQLLKDDDEYIQLQAELDVSEIDLADAREELVELKNEAKMLGIDLTQTEYGNINTDTRQKLVWDKDNLNLYKDQLISWFGENMSWTDIVYEMGDFSTVFGAWDNFGEQEIPVAFSPILQTENGPVLLDQNTVHDYISKIMEQATADGYWTLEEILKLDAAGIDGIAGLIADVGETAEKTAEAMHFTGSTGAIATITEYINSLEAAMDGVLAKIATKMQDLVNKHPVLAAALQAVGLNLNDLAGYFTQTGEYADQTVNKISATISTLDALTESVEKYKTALETVNDIAFDGQAISEDYYNTLKEELNDVTVAEQDFSDAIKEQNGKYVVKNAKLLKQLVNQSKQAKKATIEVAKAQSQLEYNTLVQDIRNKVVAMKGEYLAYGLISEATLDNISTMRKQLDVLKQTIQQYALLEIRMSKAASAYTEYENAKERDTEVSYYEDTFLEALKSIDQGLLLNETGTEEFEYAVKMIVPPEVYEGLDDVDEKVKAIHDYIDANPVFSKLFYVDEESGELDINADNVREFVKMGLNDFSVFTGTENNFQLAEGVDSVEDVAKAYGITEAAALAMLAALEKVDARWGNILTDLTTKPLEKEVNASIDEVDKATKSIEDFWKEAIASGKFDETEYQKLVEQLNEANAKLQENEQVANDNAYNWSLCQAAINSYKGELKLTQEQADYLSKSLGILDENGNPTLTVDDNGSLQLADDQVAIILSKLKELKEPAIVRIQTQYDKVVNEVDQIQQYIDKKGWTKGLTLEIGDVKITNEEEARAKMSELTIIKDEIEFTYKITETSTEEDKSVLESYQDLAKNGVNFTVTANVTEAKKSLDDVAESQDEIDLFTPIVVTAYASTAERALKDVVDQLDKIKDKNITITVTKVEANGESGGSVALGNAFASGTIGLNQSQQGAVVGEIGPEMVVDPIKGIYYTVGDHGTEMVDLPKGAIIYNHKQTEELLKNGRTSRGKTTGGMAWARGNAYGYGIPSYHPNYEDKTSFANGADLNTKWDDALSTLNSTASEASDKFEEVFDWIEVRLAEITEQLDLMNAQLENAVGYKEQNQIIDAIIDVNDIKLDNLKAGLKEYTNYAAKLLAKVPAQFQEAAQNGAIAITEFAGEADEKTVEAINNYREWAQKAADLRQQIEELETENADLAKQKFDNISTEFENIISLTEAANDKLDAQISLMEDRGYVAAKAYYEAMAENTKDINAELIKERDTLQSVLDEQVKLGNIKVGSEAWYEMVQQLYDVDAAIVECESDLESFQNAINDIYWDNFDELIQRYDYISDETQNLIDLLGHDDMVVKMDNEDGWSSDEVKWTEEGISSLGLYAQQMEIAEYKSKQYAKAIEDLNKDYKDGKYSESEYLEKLNDLKDSQYDSIEAYHDAKEAIKDLNSEMVDMVKEGLEKQIEAYEELAEKRKEALDAEKDAIDFEKSISKQTKSIADIDRQLSALSGNNSIAAAAKRKQLEAERAELQAELDEMYYDRSVENQKEAIDKEVEIYTEAREKEIEQWEKYLEDIEKVVADSLSFVQTNASTVYDTLNEKANEYGLNVSDAVVLPWTDGENAISSYTEVFGDATSSTVDQLTQIKTAWQEVIDKMTEAADIEIAAQKKANDRYIVATKQENTNTKPNNNTSPATKAVSVGSTINASGATIYASSDGSGAGRQYYSSDPVYVVVGENNGYWKVRHRSLSSGVTGWFKKSDVKAYAKGTLGTPEDQFAWLDELGEELVMHADGNGRLSFLTKGTSVIPADLTKNLMALGQLDPSDVLDRNRPQIGLHPEVHSTEVNITMDIAEVVHIDTVTNDTIPNLTKAIDKQLDKYMKQLNGQIRRYAK